MTSSGSDDSAASFGSAETGGVGEAVRYELRGSGVAVVTLNRPERMNTWSADIAAGFYSSFDKAEADPAVRVIVVTGAGRAFCAGASMGSLSSKLNSSKNFSEIDIGKLVGERHPHFVTGGRKPVIAAINGACAGMGFTQALMCDIRFAAAGAKFTTAFARRGLIAEYGISWILPRVVGWSAAVDLLLTGRVFSAAEAKDLGIVLDVLPSEGLLDHVISYAEEIATQCAPSALAVIKRQLYDDSSRDVMDSSARAEALMHESLRRPDFIEGISSFVEKRPPHFPPLHD